MMKVLFYTLVLCFLCNAASKSVDSHPNWSLLPKECGKANETQFRIYGGQDAELGQFPWLVRIFVEQGDAEGFNCGGGLISSRHVVTAAHCGDNVKILSIRAGEYNIATTVDCDEFDCAPEFQDVPILFFLPHPDWDVQKLHNDIALIKLAGSVHFHNYVQPLCLPGRYPLFENYVPTGNVQLAGWGHTDSNKTSVHGRRGEKLPDILQFVNLEIKDINFCTSYFSSTEFLPEGQLCIGAPNGRDTCEGDSGGPVMKEIKVMNGYRFFILGVVSFGSHQCGEAPAIYTNVRYYLNWILDNL